MPSLAQASALLQNILSEPTTQDLADTASLPLFVCRHDSSEPIAIRNPTALPPYGNCDRMPKLAP